MEPGVEPKGSSVASATLPGRVDPATAVLAPIRPPRAAPAPDDTEVEPLPPELVADLDAPDLVLTDGYVGRERRRSGRWARLGRATFPSRRSALRVELLVVALVVAIVMVAAVSVGVLGRSRPTASRTPQDSALGAALADPLRGLASGGTAAAPGATPAPKAPTSGAAPSAPVATPTPPPSSAPTTTVPVAAPPPAPPADATPQQLGTAALALVRYPWQRIPGYSIQFEPISDAPSPGFYGNTTFTWGHAGGTSVLYVYPGETVQRLAGITAFEIGHEVDAAAVEPQGGETQIENILGIHPASWAPDCDCAEQGYLSGWYAAAFSDYWSPGVGQWSQLAPEPTGATLAAVEPWLNPSIP